MSRPTSPQRRRPRPLADIAEMAWTTNDERRPRPRNLHRTMDFPTAAEAAAAKQRRGNAKGIVLRGQNQIAVTPSDRTWVYGKKGDNSP